MQAQLVEAEIVLALHRHGHFFNRIHARVALRTGDAHGGRLVLLSFDEVIRAEAHVLALVDRGDVIGAVLADGHAGDTQAIFAGA